MPNRQEGSIEAFAHHARETSVSMAERSSLAVSDNGTSDLDLSGSNCVV